MPRWTDITETRYPRTAVTIADDLASPPRRAELPSSIVTIPGSGSGADATDFEALLRGLRGVRATVDDLVDKLGIEFGGGWDDDLKEFGLGFTREGGDGGGGSLGPGPSLFESIGGRLGMRSDYGGYGTPGIGGYPATPTPIETGPAGDPYTGNPYEQPSGFAYGSLGFGIGPKGNASATVSPSSSEASASAGVVVSGVFDLTPAPAATTVVREKPKDEAKQPDRRPVEKPVGPIQKGVDEPKKRPGTGVARPDPMNERGAPDATALRRIRREFAPPDWKSDQPGFGSNGTSGDPRIVAIDWDLASGGGVTDPVPYGDTQPRRFRKRRANIGWTPPKPTSDDPSVFGTASIAAYTSGVGPAKR